MGVVYQARDLRLNCLVALKSLPPGMIESPLLNTRLNKKRARFRL